MPDFIEIFTELVSNLNFSLYYGIDWLAMLLTLIAIYLIGNKSRIGFYLMIFGNLCWIALGLLSQSIAMIIANFLFVIMNIRAIILWAEED
jgi:hypothetical protein